MRELKKRIKDIIIEHIVAEEPKRPLLRACFWQSIEIDIMFNELISRSREYLTGRKEQK